MNFLFPSKAALFLSIGMALLSACQPRSFHGTRSFPALRCLLGIAPRTESIEFGWQKCLELRNAGWKDGSGKRVYVPVGDFRGTHHSSCYRIFNVDREIAVHHYPSVNKEPVFGAL